MLPKAAAAVRDRCALEEVIVLPGLYLPNPADRLPCHLAYRLLSLGFSEKAMERGSIFIEFRACWEGRMCSEGADALARIKFVRTTFVK